MNALEDKQAYEDALQLVQDSVQEGDIFKSKREWPSKMKFADYYGVFMAITLAPLAFFMWCFFNPISFLLALLFRTYQKLFVPRPKERLNRWGFQLLCFLTFPLGCLLYAFFAFWWWMAFWMLSWFLQSYVYFSLCCSNRTRVVSHTHRVTLLLLSTCINKGQRTTWESVSKEMKREIFEKMIGGGEKNEQDFEI